MKTVIIFYSWQSDLPGKTNRNAIRSALLAIAGDLQGEDVHVTIDDATRDEPGSPAIASTIMSKIDAADIFVADISTINGSNQGLVSTEFSGSREAFRTGQPLHSW